MGSPAKIVQGDDPFDRSRKGKSGNPRIYAGTITGSREPRSPFRNHDRREVPHPTGHSTGITGYDPDPLAISALKNSRNGLGHEVTKSFVFQGLKESATAFKVDPIKILARENKKGKMPHTKLLKAKTLA